MNFVSWPEESESPLSFHVAPADVDKKTINTLVVDKSKTYVYWSSPNLLTPVTSGWFLHAASVAGCGEEFDVMEDSTVRWEHFQVASHGLVGLQLADGRTYLFYITPESADESKLRNSHLPWMAHAHRVVHSPPVDYILIPAQPLVIDDHGKEVAQSEDFSIERTFSPEYAFEGYEHQYVGTTSQTMIDNWAANGLIDGGALIDSSPPKVEDWKFILPYELQGTAPAQPYGNVPPGSKYHWHYILPDPKVDSKGHNWTSKSLRQEIQTGEAVAVTVGHILMLAGDYFESFDDMKIRKARDPVSSMQGFDQGSRFAFMVMDLLNFPRWSGGKYFFLKDVAESPEKAEKAEKENHKKVEKLVSVLRNARGPTRFSEIHVLAQMWGGIGFGRNQKTTAFPLKDMEERLPWFKINRDDINKTLNDADVQKKLDDPGFDAQFFDMVITNGHYTKLALQNEKHFNPFNWSEFESYHRKALQLIDQQTKITAPHHSMNPIPAESIATTAFGLHFLTDAFSAGHMRVPRDKLGASGALASKLMHDLDGLYGLTVQSRRGERPTQWRAFGDGCLSPDKVIGTPQTSVLQRLKLSGDENRDNVTYAAGAALKQLHYEAQRVAMKNTKFKKILHNSRGHQDWGLMWDNTAPGVPSEKWKVEERIAQDIPAKIAYLQELKPEPFDVGKKSDIHFNHPPLFLQNGDLNTSAGAYEKIGKFVLNLKWHGWGEPPYPKNALWQVRLDFTNFYYLAFYTQGAGPWAGGKQSKLLDTYDKLPDG